MKSFEPSSGAQKSTSLRAIHCTDQSFYASLTIAENAPKVHISTRRMVGTICSSQKGGTFWIIKFAWHGQRVLWVLIRSRLMVSTLSFSMVMIIRMYRVLDTQTSFRTRAVIGGHSFSPYVLRPTGSLHWEENAGSLRSNGRRMNGPSSTSVNLLNCKLSPRSFLHQNLPTAG
jgi:hypothetical protein